jgi:site-specific DNA-methyltransferase (adenine-specific)
VEGTLKENFAKYGTGCMNIDGTRIAYQDDDKASATPQGDCTSVLTGHLAGGGQVLPRKTFDRPEQKGRWPANLIHDGSDEVTSLFPENKPGKMVRNQTVGARPFNNNGAPTGYVTTETIDDPGGSAARFFYCAKAARSERDAGCDDLPDKIATDTVERDPESAGARNPRAGAGRGAGAPLYRCTKCGCDGGGGRFVSPCPDSPTGSHVFEVVGYMGAVKNDHPTVKPIALMRYLIKLVTRPGGLVLDPFMGSGTTGCAAVIEGMRFIGIDLDQHHVDIANARINYWHDHTVMPPVVRHKKVLDTPAAPMLDLD